MTQNETAYNRVPFLTHLTKVENIAPILQDGFLRPSIETHMQGYGGHPDSSYMSVLIPEFKTSISSRILLVFSNKVLKRSDYFVGLQWVTNQGKYNPSEMLGEKARHYSPENWLKTEFDPRELRASEFLFAEPISLKHYLVAIYIPEVYAADIKNNFISIGDRSIPVIVSNQVTVKDIQALQLDVPANLCDSNGRKPHPRVEPYSQNSESQ